MIVEKKYSTIPYDWEMRKNHRGSCLRISIIKSWFNYSIVSGSYAIGLDPTSTTGSTGALGAGLSSAYFPRSQQQFFGAGTATTVSAGFGSGAGISQNSSGGISGYQLDILRASFGATVNIQNTTTKFLGHLTLPKSCGY